MSVTSIFLELTRFLPAKNYSQAGLYKHIHNVIYKLWIKNVALAGFFGIVTKKWRIINKSVDILIWIVWKSVRFVLKVDTCIENTLK